MASYEVDHGGGDDGGVVDDVDDDGVDNMITMTGMMMIFFFVNGLPKRPGCLSPLVFASGDRVKPTCTRK